MNNSRPVLIMAGGTGGHVFPALAIAEALRAEGVPIYWLGTKAGLESRVVPSKGIEIRYINIGGLRGKGLFSLLTAPFKISLAIWQSLRILRQIRPAVIIGLGGFVTGPGGVAAWLLRIPLLIHEQNAIAGLTNRWLARLAKQVMEAFPGTFPISYRAVHTGNPLRANIMALPATREIHQPLHILIVGGSLGAKALNETVPLALQQVKGNFEVWHQTGETHLVAMRDAYTKAPFQARIDAFIEDMAAAYSWADLVICRAGALTVSELAQAGVGSILVPFPYATDDHQRYNARFLSAQGAAILLPQTECTVERLTKEVNMLINEPHRLQQMAISARGCATPRALAEIVEIIMKLLNSK